jgi:hypothetical protein
MKIAKALPPHDLQIRVPADTMAALKLYQRYQKDVGKESWDLKDLVGALLGVFLTEGDAEFLAWRTRQTPRSTATPPGPLVPVANGASDA